MLFGFLLAGTVSACDELAPVGLVIMIDGTQSSARWREPSCELAREISRKLEKDIDVVRVFRVTSTIEWLYASERPRGKHLAEILDAYSKAPPTDHGTGYGSALERGVSELMDLQKSLGVGRKTALLLMGDGKNEPSVPGSGIDWSKHPKLFSSLGSNSEVFFCFLEPKEGTQYRDAMKPVLGERFHPYLPESAMDGTAKSEILQYLDR